MAWSQRALHHLSGVVRPRKAFHSDGDGNRGYGRSRRWPENPIRTLARPTFMNYVYFFVGWMAWTMDGYDFFTVSLSLSRLAEQYDRKRDQISTSITLTLLFRSVGAVIFGLAGDLYGRKWPMIVNLVIVAMLELATAFCTTYQQFLGVRSLFGIGMGGIWGLASSMALENIPIESRGLFSGLLQQGYSLGYLLAAVFNIGVVPHSRHSWRLLFWIGAGLTTAVAIARAGFPESKQFLARKEEERRSGSKMTAKGKVQHFMKDLRQIFRTQWRRMVYCVLLMTAFNALSHTSQDLYPTYMQQTKLFSPHLSTVATIIGTVGATVGGLIVGFLSQSLGRRFSILLTCILGLALLPLWILPSSFSLLALGAFWMQFMVQGAWGVVPIHLQELSPEGLRASFPGVVYQLGNMVASACPQIASSIAESWTTKSKAGKTIPDYGRAQLVMMAVVWVLLAVVTVCGRENRGKSFEEGAVAGPGRETALVHEKGKGMDRTDSEADKSVEIRENV
ncbi:MFS general substrate transporter [Ascobolus immersus RN42]|uniref:MFS general substrate transporter n=1 Tax=Ascobolus immersus RN42 TaxID=1160509 RepID=A0A3N4HT55_ASCIM|nr:MFS general substrate transporter [Ascobolus immersus RN42]